MPSLNLIQIDYANPRLDLEAHMIITADLIDSIILTGCVPSGTGHLPKRILHGRPLKGNY